MHMADALLSPIVGGMFWAASGMLIDYSARKITRENDPVKTPLMGVLGAFIFAAQMINFTIPGTGSSGHLGGGLLLAVLLGPYRAFITLASVLILQCLFFADGGLLALGCNIFNLAFFPSFIAFPFIYRTIAGKTLTPVRVALGCVTAATAGLLMGAFSVVLQTLLSGITEIPFTMFLLFMLPIHLAIGVVEGLVTWGILSFVLKTEPGMLKGEETSAKPRFILIATCIVAALLTGGIFSNFASTRPDGLEWSVTKVTGSKTFQPNSEPLHKVLAEVQQKIAFLPDYGFKPDKLSSTSPAPLNIGVTVSGIVGTLSLLAAAAVAGRLMGRKRSQPKSSE